MLTTEIAVTITIWVMLAAGCFFTLRAAWQRRRARATISSSKSESALSG